MHVSGSVTVEHGEEHQRLIWCQALSQPRQACKRSVPAIEVRRARHGYGAQALLFQTAGSSLQVPVDATSFAAVSRRRHHRDPPGVATATAINEIVIEWEPMARPKILTRDLRAHATYLRLLLQEFKGTLLLTAGILVAGVAALPLFPGGSRAPRASRLRRVALPHLPPDVAEHAGRLPGPPAPARCGASPCRSSVSSWSRRRWSGWPCCCRAAPIPGGGGSKPWRQSIPIMSSCAAWGAWDPASWPSCARWARTWWPSRRRPTRSGWPAPSA